MNSTDDAWRAWGERDPYFAVLTNPIFRRANLDEAAMREFFESGERQVDHLLFHCRRHFGSTFSFGRTLDFGCGVGRILVPMARIAAEVVGVDVSPAMLDEAREHCVSAGVSDKVTLALSDDGLTRVEGTFDFVYSVIVLQHIDVERGRAFFERLVDLLAPDGVAALHVTYAKAAHAERFGRPPELPIAPSTSARIRSAVRVGLTRLGLIPPRPSTTRPDPQMQMNSYSLNDLLFIAQRRGVQTVHVELTDHGGELGAVLLFRRPAVPVPTA